MRALRPVLGLLSLMLSAAAGASPPVPIGTSGERDVILVNQSGRVVNEVYASPSDSEQWGPDRLGDSTIPPHQQVRVRLGAGSAAHCVFDIQIVYSDASHEERRGQDVCRLPVLSFDAAAAMPAAEPGIGDHRLLIADATDMAIQQILISSAESGDWGEDRLGGDALRRGQARAVTYRGGCVADLRVVFDNRAAEERRGLDLCALGGVTIAPGWTTATHVAAPGRAAAASPAFLSVVIVNHAGRTLQSLYLYPERASLQGPDRLGAAPLADGGRVVAVLPRPAGPCRYTARIVQDGADSEQVLTGLDLCHEPTLIVPPRRSLR